MRPIWYRTAHELREMLTRGEITSAELTKIYLDRIAALDGRDGLNSVAELDPTAMAQAEAADRAGLKGPLAGLPVLVKDNIDVAGLHTTAGSFTLEDNLAAADAPVVTALRKAGAVILGKTNMTEFANFTTAGMPGGFSSHGGQVRHAYDRKRDPSGSSSGSAVAASAGLCAFALGTDTSFSVVICASEHGVCGYKPPMGVLPQQGIVPISHTLDSVGILARDMRDVLMIRSALTEKPLPELTPVPPEKMKIAVNTANRHMTAPTELSRYRRYRKKLEAAGVSFGNIRQMPPPELFTLMVREFGPDLESYLAGSSCRMKTLPEIVSAYRADPSRRPYGITLLEAALSAMEDSGSSVYEDALAERERIRLRALKEIEDFDVCWITGPTSICHLMGIPSLSVPVCMGRDRRPHSVLLYGADEERLLSAALTLESFATEILPPEL